jgi:hypothetical protein
VALHQVPDSIANPRLTSEPCTGRAADYRTKRSTENGAQATPDCRSTNCTSGLRIVVVSWHEASLVSHLIRE